jgi:hypothetical protein
MKKVVALSITIILACALNTFAQSKVKPGTLSNSIPAATSESIHYVIQFTAASGVAPTSGSFDYDSSNPTGSRFQNFFVNWAGASFDFTQAANLLRWCAGNDCPSARTPGQWKFQCAPMAGSVACIASLSYTPPRDEERSIVGLTGAPPTMGAVANGTWYATSPR